jgi:flagellin
MSRINTNVQALIAQRVLGQNQFSLGQALERLSTGLRISRGKDDPAGLIASERLRAELRAMNTAVSNSERADQVVNIAEGGLQEISNLLTELQGLLTATASKAGLSTTERQANQLQVDSILQTIDRISASTNFQGLKLLNGTFEFKTSSVHAGVTDFRINSAKFAGSNLRVDVQVTQSAQNAVLYMSMMASQIDLSSNTAVFRFEVAGALGSRELSFGSGTSITTIVDQINAFRDVTGVSATASSGTNTRIRLTSTGWGKDQFVSVRIVDAGGIGGGGGIAQAVSNDMNTSAGSGVAFASANNGVRDEGQNLGATINGIAATTDGRRARIATDFLDVELTLDATRATTLGNYTAFYVTGGGADFQLAGNVDITGKAALGINDVSVRKLGSSEVGGFLYDLSAGKSLNIVDGDINKAQRVVYAAIEQVSAMRGRLGAFQKNTIGATIRSLGVAIENTAAAQSVIRDADFATETAQLTRNQILSQASTSILALANNIPQGVLQLLG